MNLVNSILLDQWPAFLELAGRPYYGNSGPATKWKLEMTAPIWRLREKNPSLEVYERVLFVFTPKPRKIVFLVFEVVLLRHAYPRKSFFSC